MSSTEIQDLDCPTHRTEVGISENKSRGTVAFSAKNYTPANDFNVTWNSETKEFLVLTNKRPDDDAGYFLAQVSPAVFAGDRRPPERLLIVVDGSGSVDPQSFSVAREFAAAAAEMVEGWQFNVALSGYETIFMNEDFEVAKAGDAKRVYKFLDSRMQLGGTDMLKTFEAIAAKLPSKDRTHIIYVGDGINTLGAEEGAGLIKAIVQALEDVPAEVSCVSIGSSYDRLVLEGLASKMGGTFRPVEGVDNVFVAADSILGDFSRPVYRSVQVQFEGVETGALYPAGPVTVSEGETAIILGRIIKGGTGKAIVSGIAEGQPFKKVYPIELTGNTEQNHFVPRLWATAHMDSIRARMGLSGPKADGYLRNQVIATSLNYQIMSPFTAFLCLESEEDYKKFGIVRRNRMVDWKGELAGVTNAAPGVAARVKPKKPKPNLKHVRVPVPPLRFVPQEILDEARGLIQIENQLQQSAESQKGGVGGGVTLYTSAISGSLWPMLGSIPSEKPVTSWFSHSSSRRSGSRANLARYDVRDLLSAIPGYSGTGLPSIGEGGGEISLGDDLFGDNKDEDESKESRLDFLGNNAVFDTEKDVDGEISLGAAGDIDFLTTGTEGTDKLVNADRSELFAINGRFGRDLLLFEGGKKQANKALEYYYGPGFSDGLGFAQPMNELAKSTERMSSLGRSLRKRGGYGYRGYRQQQLYPQSYLKRNNIQSITLKDGETLKVRWHVGGDVYLQRSLLANPEDLQTRLDLALSLASRRRLAEARRTLEPMLNDGQSASLWLEFAWLDYHLGDRAESKASVQKAIPLAADLTTKQHCGYELSTLGAHTEASDYFLKLAEEEETTPNHILNFFGYAYSYANSSPELRATAHTIWEKAIRKLPNHEQALARAVKSLQSAQPELALKYIAQHESLVQRARFDHTPSDLYTSKLNCLFAIGRRDEAWKTLEQRARTAADHNAVYQALYTAHNRDQRRAYKLVAEILSDEETYPLAGPQLHGAVRFHQSYNSTFEAQKRIRELASREDLPAVLRTSIFYAMHRHGGRNREWAKVLLPLKKVNTVTDLATAITAAQALISYGYHADAAQFVEGIANAKAINEAQSKQIAMMRWQILANSGDIEKAVKHLEEIFKSVKDPLHAYNLLSNSIYQLINHNRAETCIKLHAEMFKRFPSYANNRYLYQNLFNQLRNRGQLDLLRKHRESLPEAEESSLVKMLGAEWDKVVALAKEKEFGKAFNALEKFQDTLSENRAKLTKEMEIAATLLKQIQSKSNADNAEETRKKLRDLQKNYDDLLGDYNVCVGLMEVAFRLRIQLAANDEELAMLFLKECDRKANNEDPRTREWTQAKLLCLALTGDRATYREALEDLYKSEPQDPIWPRLLLNARFAEGDSEGGMELLTLVCKQDPFDIRLARMWYSIQKRIGNEDEITAARDQYFRALAIMPNVLQQLANRWQQGKNIELAVAAWLAMQQTPSYTNNGWPTYQAASTLQATDKERAIELYFQIFSRQTYAASYGQNSLSQLRSLMNDEATRNLIEKRLPELTEAKAVWTRNCGYILAAHVAQIRKQDFKPHLENLFKISEKDLQNVTSAVMDIFVQAKAFDQLYEYVIAQLKILAQHQKQNVIQTAAYRLISSGRRDQKVQNLIKKFISLARSDELSLSGHQRSNMLRNIASNLGSYKETRPLATQIYRDLIEQHDANASNNLYQLVQWLVNDNRVAEARELLEKHRGSRTDWNLWYAHDLVIQRVGHNQKNYVLAARIAYEAWKKWDSRLQNYGQNVFNRFTEMSWNAIRKGGLPADLKEALRKEILRLGEGHFQGRNVNAYNQGHLWNCIESLGLVDTLRKMAEAAYDSEDSRRVFNAARFASYASNYKHKMFDEAERGYRKLLDMKIAPQDLKTQTYSQLYSLYTNSHFKRWADAIEILEPWKTAGNLQKETYLYNRGYCLYKLRRNKEGREVVLELLKQPNYRRYYWNAQNIATWCREAKDYITEVECLEHGMRWMRYIGQLQPNYVTQFYTAMGNAYRNMGETEKSYEAFLRGMSLLNRNRNDWYYRNLTDNLIKSMKKDAKKGGLDGMVAYYEQNMLKGGEMPHMRIAFGNAYEKAKQNLKALQQYSIAADLMPKDTTLRDKVIKGFVKEGRNDLAEKEYLSWAKLDPQNVSIYKRLGEHYEKMDLYRLAMSAFTAMPEARPREAEGHQQFARILISKNKLQEAVAPFQKAIKYRPALFTIADEYAKLQARLGADGKKLEAIFVNGEDACRRSMEVLEDDPLPWLNLARFLKAQERKGEAKTLLKEILNRRWPRFARETKDEARKILKAL
ncbi:MAG: hypothetical protein QF473_11500 [Planctomycetota bacterium]|nr:hypothetical protein [Planctomycetota bacterium]